jgi:hypothetical protein
VADADAASGVETRPISASGACDAEVERAPAESKSASRGSATELRDAGVAAASASDQLAIAPEGSDTAAHDERQAIDDARTNERVMRGPSISNSATKPERIGGATVDCATMNPGSFRRSRWSVGNLRFRTQADHAIKRHHGAPSSA